MLTAFVTGGTGFVGLNLVRELRAAGWQVIACHRAGSNLHHLQRFTPELRVADVLDLPALMAALPERVDAVFHLAASINFWRPRNIEQTLINVQGTRHVVEAALQRKARRFIHMSSLAAWAPGRGDLIDESTPSRAQEHPVNYFRTKWLAEQVVLKAVERGLPACVLNPGNILGPYDTQTWARSFRMAKQRKLPFLPPGGGPFCHVQDVVQAALAAVERGGVGERYVLGGVHASYAELFERVCALLAVPRPAVAPAWLFSTLSVLSDGWSRLSRTPPDLTPDMAGVLGIDFDARSRKAERQLGYQRQPFSKQVQDTFDWLRSEQLI
jgi:nucleoside-diphosphate-sugar epimerase